MVKNYGYEAQMYFPRWGSGKTPKQAYSVINTFFTVLPLQCSLYVQANFTIEHYNIVQFITAHYRWLLDSLTENAASCLITLIFFILLYKSCDTICLLAKKKLL